MPDLATDQRAILDLLLQRHPALVHLQDLQAELPAANVEFAVSMLCGDGLATRIGDGVGATRASVRFGQLERR